MAGTGKVIALIKALGSSGASPEEIKAAVAEWLAEHVDPDTGYVIDDTFSIPGAAPDAKLTGDKLNDLKSAFNDYGVTEHTTLSDRFAKGYYNVTDGSRVDTADKWIRMNIPLDVVGVYSIADTMKLYLSAFSLSDGTYIGMWNGSTYAKVYDASAMGFSKLNIAEFRKAYPAYAFCLNVNQPSASISYSDRANIKFIISINDGIAPIADGMVDEIVSNIEFEQGSLNANGSEDNNSSSLSKRIRSVYFSVNGELMVTAKYPANFSIYIFDSDKTLLTKTDKWQEGYYKVTDTKNRLFRVIVRKLVDETSISVNNASDYLSITDTLRYNIFDTVNGLNIRTSALQLPNVKVVNHRGYNVIAPENTLPAFQMSADLGYKYVETDVLFTSDGVPVLMHDASINRTARNPDGTALSSTVNIADITYEEALEYDYGIWKAPKYAGTPIPTFAQFMALCKRTGLHPYIELKNEKTYTQEEVDLILQIIKQYGMKDHVTFISYSDDALALVKTSWEDAELGLNGTVEDTIALRTNKNRVFNLCASNTASSKIESLIENDVPICYWTIDTKTSLNALDPCYDSILTNGLTNKQVYEALNNITV